MGPREGFALAPSDQGTPIDPGPAATPSRSPTSSAASRQAALDVLRYSSQLDPADGATVDISPGALGDNTLGTNDGNGHDVNPATGEPYAPNVVLRADFERALAEYWADGPKSETPPGHWNVIANAVSDAPGFEHRIGGEGSELDRLEWDVKLYFALNGAVHDAAVAAWGLKGFYDSARPISMIRYMGGKGQSSDPDGPVVRPEACRSRRTGRGRHRGLERARPAARASRRSRGRGRGPRLAGVPRGSRTRPSGVGWILAVDWVPYQRSTFVTPAFAGYVSGHSTFSRAAAEVMTAFTGSEFFPGGLYEDRLAAGELIHEEGPDEPITIQWATYSDAADQAGISRLFMGIHISADDVEGRWVGAKCGEDAWALASEYFAGPPTTDEG